MLMRLHDGVAKLLIKQDGPGIVDVDVESHVSSSTLAGGVLGNPDQCTAYSGSLNLSGDVQAVQPGVRRSTATGPSNACYADDTDGRLGYQHAVVAKFGGTYPHFSSVS